MKVKELLIVRNDFETHLKSLAFPAYLLKDQTEKLGPIRSKDLAFVLERCPFDLPLAETEGTIQSLWFHITQQQKRCIFLTILRESFMLNFATFTLVPSIIKNEMFDLEYAEDFMALFDKNQMAFMTIWVDLLEDVYGGPAGLLSADEIRQVRSVIRRAQTV